LGVAVAAAAAFGLACIGAALSFNAVSFAVALVIVGATSLTMMNTANAYVQTTTEPSIRGRVMAIYLALFAGGTPIGAPVVGWVANVLGPRWALGIGALSGLAAASVAIVWLVAGRGMRVGRTASRFGLELRFSDARDNATQEIAIVESTAKRVS
jgi:MFS family permease